MVMKICIAQINTRVGDLDGNTDRVIQNMDRARSQGADLTVFPELAVVGYPPEDLLEKPVFVQKNLEALERIRLASSGQGVVVGFVSPNSSSTGRALHNSVALIDRGQIIAVRHKSLLPNYDVFDEQRYFEPSKEREVADFRGMKLGLSICEDSWNDKDFWNKQLYHVDPIHDLVSGGADLLINIAASPFNFKKPLVRTDMFRNIAEKYRVPSVFVNLVGGNDSLVFDGCSFAMAANGTIQAAARAFEEDLVFVDFRDSSGVSLDQWPASEEEQLFSALVLGLRDYLGKCGFRKTIVGLSGGIDSAVVAAIASHAIGPNNVLGVSMPSRYSSQHSRDDAAQLAHSLGMNFQTIPIEDTYSSFLSSLKDTLVGRPPDTTEENLQARIRGTILMALSNRYGAMVLSTGNKSELAVGYCTIYGDMCGGLAVISDVPKTMVYRLARWLNRDRQIIPARTMTKAPSAELRPDQTDQDSLPPYDILDGILKAYIEDAREEKEIVEMGYERQTVERVLRLVDHNEYKRRQAAPGIRVTTKAFGYGRRIPIAQGWR